MPYTPSFLEMYLALLVLLAWSAWLVRREGGFHPVASRVPWALGLAVLGGQVIAGTGVLLGMSSPDDPSPWQMVEAGRWLGIACEALGLVVLGALTGRSLARGRPAQR